MGLLFFYSAFSLIPIKISLHLHQPISTLSLSLPCSTISLLSLPLLHVIASLSDETLAEASGQADLFFFLFFFSFFCNDLKPNSAVSGWVS